MQALKHNSFNLHKTDSSWLFRNLFFLYFPNNLYTYVMNSIFATEIIETLPILKQLISNEVGSVVRGRLVALRIAVWFAAVAISFGMKDVVHVLNLSGSLFTPIVSYFGPVISAQPDGHLLLLLQRVPLPRLENEKNPRLFLHPCQLDRRFLGHQELI